MPFLVQARRPVVLPPYPTALLVRGLLGQTDLRLPVAEFKLKWLVRAVDLSFWRVVSFCLSEYLEKRGGMFEMDLRVCESRL